MRYISISVLIRSALLKQIINYQALFYTADCSWRVGNAISLHKNWTRRYALGAPQCAAAADGYSGCGAGPKLVQGGSLWHMDKSEHQVLSTSCFTTSFFLLPHTTLWSIHSHRQLIVNQLRLVNKPNVTVGQCVVCEASKAILSNWWDPSKSTAFSFSTVLLITSRSSLAQEDQTKGRRKITTLRSMRCREGSRVVLSQEEWGEMVTAFVSNIGCKKRRGINWHLCRLRRQYRLHTRKSAE